MLKYALVQYGATSAECQTAMETQLDLTTVEEKLRIQSLVKLAGTALCIVYSSGRILPITVEIICLQNNMARMLHCTFQKLHI